MGRAKATSGFVDAVFPISDHVSRTIAVYTITLDRTDLPSHEDGKAPSPEMHTLAPGRLRHLTVLEIGRMLGLARKKIACV